MPDNKKPQNQKPQAKTPRVGDLSPKKDPKGGDKPHNFPDSSGNSDD